jgi:hypothetical protein
MSCKLLEIQSTIGILRKMGKGVKGGGGGAAAAAELGVESCE